MDSYIVSTAKWQCLRCMSYELTIFTVCVRRDITLRLLDTVIDCTIPWEKVLKRTKNFFLPEMNLPFLKFQLQVKELNYKFLRRSEKNSRIFIPNHFFLHNRVAESELHTLRSDFNHLENNNRSVYTYTKIELV